MRSRGAKFSCSRCAHVTPLLTLSLCVDSMVCSTSSKSRTCSSAESLGWDAGRSAHGRRPPCPGASGKRHRALGSDSAAFAKHSADITRSLVMPGHARAHAEARASVSGAHMRVRKHQHSTRACTHTVEEHDDGGGRPAAHGRALEERERLATRELRLAVHEARPRRCLRSARAHGRERVGRRRRCAPRRHLRPGADVPPPPAPHAHAHAQRVCATTDFRVGEAART